MSLYDDTPDLFMHHNFTIRLTRFIANHLVSSHMQVKIEFSVNPEANADGITRVWNKIDYWLETIEQSTAVWASNELGISTLIDPIDFSPKFVNNIMIVPGEPTEEVLGYVLQAKLNALGEDVLAFGSVEIGSAENNGIVFTVLGDPDIMLPNMEEWMGLNNWFNTPWWNRDDGSMLDAQPPENADISVRPEWAYDWDFLGERPKPSTVSLAGRFKPRLVDEEKDD